MSTKGNSFLDEVNDKIIKKKLAPHSVDSIGLETVNEWVVVSRPRHEVFKMPSHGFSIVFRYEL